MLFLVLVLNVKLLVKVVAVILFTWLNRRMLLAPVIIKQKFILFYGAMICIAVLNTLIYVSSFSISYLVVVCTGIGFWLLCGLSAMIISEFVRNSDVKKLHATLTLFFVLNALVTFSMLIWIMLDARTINPYTFQGFYQKYFISTGDRMTGISFDISTTNALFNAFGVVYFLSRQKMTMVLLCMSVLILTSSNFTNVIIIVVLLYLFIFQSNRNQKSIIIICFLMLLIFLVKISPQNNSSAINIFKKISGGKPDNGRLTTTPVPVTQRPDSILSDEEKKQKLAMLYLDSIARLQEEKKEQAKDTVAQDRNNPAKLNFIFKPVIPKPNIHSAPFQMNTDTTDEQKKLLVFALNNIPAFDTNSKEVRSRRIPGKIISFQQTFSYFKKNPLKLITGCSMGRFSSKLAFRATGLQISGGFPRGFVFADKNFVNNHLDLYITYFSKHKELHSLINTPNSVYDQLIAEYGIAGLLSFIMLYLSFFLRKVRKLSYGVPLLIIMLGAFTIDYWFEQLSIVILFELLMLINIKETTK